ncbi:centromere-associated protein E isoform X3 [Ornithorhynchus anatinus]|uniref:centromere-associated protein E isoform X3 n=1 Tax=Ornithorhynchus anatinus TaxID=9258 RepID=UPI0010A89B4C|nr:centromere-associated protein E isoform X3 [Ornithorhynchus anatinus]
MAEEGAVTVCVRVRPLISREKSLGDASQLFWKTDNRVISQTDGTKSFSFDRVFHSNESTPTVYEEIAVPIIGSALQGYNGTIFAYGQTASGKTYTMMGSEDSLGIIPKAIDDIFEKIKEIPDREFLLRVSYMEIYNETVTDLLCDTRKMKPLEIREDFNRNVYVADLTEEVVVTAELALRWILKGEKNRHYGKTKMNQRSSRSHTIFRMIVESREKRDSSNCDGAVMVSHLNLVDLAGSERASQTGAEGIRLKEGCNINRSLFILGQVIKKLSDGQAGGFINYRDSKLTRILQNSLGGNAKTAIICTITPMSFDETLSTLQFASTAKYMKNAPHVNEVLDDEALLKRYRKEIMDLKKRLEEVSSETRAHAMEKDQLAQLLEEKDLLQKVQKDKIDNLTEMLVTSSSHTFQQDLKAKRKRRVTWCPGKLKKEKELNCVENFRRPVSYISRRSKVSEIDELASTEDSEFEPLSLDMISESEWNPATKLSQIQEQDLSDSVQLCETLISEKENIESELNSLRTNFDNLVLDYEQLKRENTEMQMNLKEKRDLDEFEALERQTEQAQEMECKSKLDLLQEKENQIKELQSHIEELQKQSTGKVEVSFSMANTEKLSEDLEKMKQSLHDTEIIALDAKKESAFLRSENLELKEKMKELSNTYEQMEKDLQLHQSQLAAEKVSYKKMQADLQKELQYAFTENTKLTSLMDGKVPKDLLSSVELERKLIGLRSELDKVVEENTALQKEVNILSEFKSSNEVELLRKELSDKIQELQQKTVEQEQLDSLKEELSVAREKLNDLELLRTQLKARDSALEGLEMEKLTITQQLQDNLEEIRTVTREKVDLTQLLEALQMERDQLKEDIQDTVKMNIDTQEELRNAFESLKQHQEVITKLKRTISDKESEALDSQEKLKKTIDELQHKVVQLTEEQNLVNPERNIVLTAVSGNAETESNDELFQKQKEQISSLIQEKHELQQLLESVTFENDQLKCDLKENIEMTIENQEELRNIGDALREQQELVTKERHETAEKEAELLRTHKKLTETEEKLHEKIKELEEKQKEFISMKDQINEAQPKLDELVQLKEQLRARDLTLEAVKMEKLEITEKLQESLEEMAVVTKERNELKMSLKTFQMEHSPIKESGTLSLKQELENASLFLMTPQDPDLEENHLKMESPSIQKNVEMISELQRKKALFEQELENMKMEDKSKRQEQLRREEATENQYGMSEMEQLKEQLKRKESALGMMEMEKLEITQRLQACLEEIKSLTKERDKLKRIQEDLQVERGQLTENLGEITSDLEKQLKSAHEALKGNQGIIDKMKETIFEKESQLSNIQVTLEKTSDALQQKIQELQENEKQLLSMGEEAIKTQKKLSEIEDLKEKLKNKDFTLQSIEVEKLEMAQKLQASLEDFVSVTEERDQLRRNQEVLQAETDVLKENRRKILAGSLEMQEELENVHVLMKENQGMIDKLRRDIAEKESQILNTQEELKKSNDVWQQKVLELQGKEQLLSEVEQLKEQLKVQDLTLKHVEMEKLEFAQKFQASLEEILSVTKERDHLKWTHETLQTEIDHLKERIKETDARNWETQEALKSTQVCLKEHQKTINLLEENISERDFQISNIQEDLNRKRDALEQKYAKVQSEMDHLRAELNCQKELVDYQKNLVLERERELLKKEERLSEETILLKEKIDDLTNELNVINAEKQRVAAKLEVENEQVEQLKKQIASIQQERDHLQNLLEAASAEKSQLQARLQKSTEWDENSKQTEEKVKIKSEPNTIDEPEQHSNKNLREKCLKIKELLKRFPELKNDCDWLMEISLALKKESVAQTTSLNQVLAELSLEESKQLEKLQAQNCMLTEEFQIYVLKKLKYVLGTVAQKKEEHHKSINDFTMGLIEEREKQNKLLIQMQNVQKNFETGIQELNNHTLSQRIDLHNEQILQDLSEMENDLPQMKAELQQVVSDRKEMCQFLENCAKTEFDIESLLENMKQKNDRLAQVIVDYNGKIKARMRAFSEFAKRSSSVCGELERELEILKEKNEEVFKELKNFKTHLAPGSNLATIFKRNHRESNVLRVNDPSLEKIQEMEVGLCQAKGNAKHKDAEVILLHQELETAKQTLSEFQAKAQEQAKSLNSAHAELEILQAKVARGAEPYKEELGDLKTKLVKVDMEMMKQSKHFEKRLDNTKAIIKHQEEVIRKLREDLRRAHQDHDTQITSKQSLPPPCQVPITCGGGSGIVQSTKALILKSEHIRMVRELSQLTQQNEQLIKEQEKLKSHNLHLTKEVRKWKDRVLKVKEACQEVIPEEPPKSPKVTEIPSLKRPSVSSPFKELISEEPTVRDSPKSHILDIQSNSFLGPRPTNYFDNSSLGLLPDIRSPKTEQSGDLLHQEHTFPTKDATECRTQ